MNLMLLLEMAAAGMGERVAVQCAGERWTHAELFAGAGRLAARIRDAGVERVSVLDVSSPAVPLALFASAWAGKPFVPINYRLTGAEVDALIERVTPVLLVTDRERARSLNRGIFEVHTSISPGLCVDRLPDGTRNGVRAGPVERHGHTHVEPTACGFLWSPPAHGRRCIG